jgi:hypothetical protein
MSEKRYAVLIASSEYQDTNLQNLRYPENDVDGLNEVLSSEKYGNFSETFVLKNRPSNEVLKKVNQVIKRAGKDDLVLIYFSGHGKLNRAGKLHLATTDTEVELLEATSIPLETIRSFIDVSASNKVAIILDSCFSGAAGAAFAKGEVDDQLQLASGGRGTYLMTSATGVQTALEKVGDRYGVFTKHIIEGIRSGEADRDDDSLITMDELYSYVHDHVLEESHQEPTKYNLNVRGDLVIARSGKSKREDRAREIRKMLLEQADKGSLPNFIISKGLETIVKKHEDLSETDLEYDHLLDQLHQNRLEMGRFIEEWYAIGKEIRSLPVEVVEEKKEDVSPKVGRETFVQTLYSKVELIKNKINIMTLTTLQITNSWIVFFAQMSDIGTRQFFPNISIYNLTSAFLFLNGFVLVWLGIRRKFLLSIVIGLVPVSSPILAYNLHILSGDSIFSYVSTLTTAIGAIIILLERRSSPIK